jgi:hypothetical protein
VECKPLYLESFTRNTAQDRMKGMKAKGREISKKDLVIV